MYMVMHIMSNLALDFPGIGVQPGAVCMRR